MRSIKHIRTKDLTLEPPALKEDADARVADGLAAMERGDEIDQEDLFASWRAKYV